MTAKEAIKIINHIFVDVTMNTHGFTSSEIAEILNMAIEALEKQVPKKPTTDEFKIFHCPSCKKEIMWDTDYGQQMTDYCAYCGQAIDWSEAKE